MNSYLVAALAVTVTVLVFVARFAYTRTRSYERLLSSAHARLRARDQEYQELRRRLGAVVHVVNASQGGIGKRLTESAQIATAIHSQEPQIFGQSPGLAHRLSANDQFLVELYSVISYAVDPDIQERIECEVKSGRDRIFELIYDAARVLPPPMTRLFGRGFACNIDRDLAHSQLSQMGYQALLEIITPVISSITRRYPFPPPPSLAADIGEAEAAALHADRAHYVAAIDREQAREARVAAGKLYAGGAVAASQALIQWAEAKEQGARAMVPTEA